MTDTPNIDDLSNFAAVFAEGLSPELRTRFAATAAEGLDANTIWQDFVLPNYVRIIDPPCFVRVGDKKLISNEGFADLFTPIVNAIPNQLTRYRDQPVKYAKSSPKLLRASEATYEPGMGDWIGTKFNMWRGPNIEPLAERPAIILDHIMYVIPDRRECGLFCDFLAWMVQRPNDRMSFALLIVGRYGVGKSWFAKLLTAMFGEQNVLVIEKGVNIADRFNAEQANKQVIFIDELVPDGKLNVARAIEPLIVASKVSIELKGKDKVWVPNRSAKIGVSNFANAIKINGSKDRKWLIVQATDDLRYSDDKNKPTKETDDYYKRLHALTPNDGTGPVTDEVRRFLWWLGKRNISSFNGQGIAPETQAKKDVAEATETTIESDIHTMIVDGEGAFAFELFTVQDVRQSLDIVQDPRNPRSAKEIEAEVSAGMVTATCRRVSDKQCTLPGHRIPTRVWTHKNLLVKYQGLTTSELAAAYKAQRQGADVGQTTPGDFDPGEATIQ